MSRSSNDKLAVSDEERSIGHYVSPTEWPARTPGWQPVAPEKLNSPDDEQYTGTKTAEGWQPISAEKMRDMREQDQHMKQRLRALRVVVRACAFGLAIFMLYTQAYMLDKYLNTRGIIRDGRNAWANQTTIWPTIVLLVSSAVSLIITTVILISYIWGVKTANWAVYRFYAPWIVVELILHLAIWIATLVAYRVGKTGNDLWGWTCSEKAAAIQIKFGEVNFDFTCGLQTDAWFASIAQAVLFVVACIVWFLAWRRSKHQKKIQHRESMLTAPTGYQPVNEHQK